MAGSSGYISFEALYEYNPSEGEIELKIGDHCLVSKPLPLTGERGWLEGVNLRTSQSGQFPGTYCRVLNYDAVPPVPRAPKPKPNPHLKNVVVKGHSLESIRVIKPVWCSLCQDYIWGSDNQSIICSSCLLCAHSGCHQAYIQPCGEEVLVGIKSKDEIRKPINEWSNEDVMEWMVAARLHPYLSIIKENNISGADLNNLTEEYLLNLGIEFRLHAKIFRMCLDELLKTPSLVALKPLSFPFQDNCCIESHEKIYEHTFTTLQNCDICRKIMFGVFSQGFMCAVCGIQCHRSCAFSTIRPCVGYYVRGRRPSDSQEPSFCCTYNTVSIPIVMRKCVEAIEMYGLQTPNLYVTSNLYEQCQALRCALNQDPNNANMKDEYWRDPHCPAYVLKSFLLELPTSLIAPECYGLFLQLCGGVEHSTKVSQVMSSLPENCYSHLHYLLRHLARVCKYSDVNQMSVETLSKEFSILLIRPSEWESRTLVSNLHLHEEVISILLTSYVNQQDKKGEEDQPSELWFWPNATRLDVAQRLSGTPDGSFIVRPSGQRKEGWTLTLRKDRKERLIRIIQCDGRIGFREDLLNFNSLTDLVNHFTMHSLVAYHPELDSKLEYPCGPLAPDVTDGYDNDIERRYIEIDEELKQIKMLEFQAGDLQKLLDECKNMSESQTDLINFLEDQINLAKDQYREAPNSDKGDIQQSIANISGILNQEKSIWAELDANLVALKHECDSVNAQLTEKSTELPHLQEEHNRLYTIMLNEKPKELKQRENEDLQAIYDDLPLRLPTTSPQQDLDVLDETYWLFQHILTKSEINAMLENKPDGTFLVRVSDNYPYVISLVHDKVIKHVPILRGPNGYGFAEPHNTYRTLSDLVNHYHNQSLRMHNKYLDTTLQTPYRFLEHTNDGPIYN